VDLTLRIILAAVLLAAAATKLRDRRALLGAVADHGVPVALRPVVAAGLVATEIVLAILLVVPATARAAGVGAAVLGLAFTVSLGAMRLRGRRRAPCRCFGSAKERPVALLMVRSLTLAAAGAAVASGVVDRAGPSFEALVALALVALALAVAVLVVLVLALYRQVGVLEGRLGPRSALELAEEGPALGHPAPPLAALERRGAELIAFSSPGCRLCAEIAPALSALEREGLVVHAVNEDEDPDAFAAFGVPGTPFVVYAVDGLVTAKGLVNTLEQIEELIAVGQGRVGVAA
jgi:thiol-disulfide isomerase/thioredoxin